MSFYTATATVNSTSYPAASAPQFNAAIGGRWDITNIGSMRVLVSFDGVTDHETVVANASWDSNTTICPGKVWLRLAAAGSCDVTGNLVARSAFGAV